MKHLIACFDRYVNRTLEWLVIGFLAVMTVVVLAQVLFRGIHASIIWSEELSIYLMVWCTFVGAGLCCRRGAMIGLEAVQMALPPKVRRWVVALAALLTALFLTVLCVVGVQISVQMWSQTTPIMKLPMGLIYAAVPAGAILMAVNTLFSAYEVWKGVEP